MCSLGSSTVRSCDQGLPYCLCLAAGYRLGGEQSKNTAFRLHYHAIKYTNQDQNKQNTVNYLTQQTLFPSRYLEWVAYRQLAHSSNVQENRRKPGGRADGCSLLCGLIKIQRSIFAQFFFHNTETTVLT